MQVNIHIKQRFSRFARKLKMDWRDPRTISKIIILVMLLAAIGSLIFNYAESKSVKIVQKFISAPTGMDDNFMTQVNECFIPTAALYGYTLRITSAFRSRDEQAAIYDQGRTVNGHIVTEAPPGKSIHAYGFAVDVVDRWRGFNINWVKLGKIGTYCGLEQGPDGDTAHFEHRGGLSTKDFAIGKRPDPLKLPCAAMDMRAKINKPLTLNDLKSCGAPSF